MSRGCPLLMRSLFIRLTLYFPYPTIKIRLLKLLDFEIERNERKKTKEKITQAISKVIKLSFEFGVLRRSRYKQNGHYGIMDFSSLRKMPRYDKC